MNILLLLLNLKVSQMRIQFYMSVAEVTVQYYSNN